MCIIPFFAFVLFFFFFCALSSLLLLVVLFHYSAVDLLWCAFYTVCNDDSDHGDDDDDDDDGDIKATAGLIFLLPLRTHNSLPFGSSSKYIVTNVFFFARRSLGFL